MSEKMSRLPKSERIYGVDLVKAVGIFGVVFIHSSGGGEISDAFSAFFRWAVPVFLIFFGYFLEKGILKSGRPTRYLTGRLTGIVIPFVVWSTVYWFVIPAFHSRPDFGFFQFLSSLGYAWNGQYFFLLLLQLLLFFPVLRRFSDLHRWLMVTLAVFVLTLAFIRYLPNLDPKLDRFVEIVAARTFVLWWPYTVFGIFLARKGKMELPGWTLWIPALLFFENWLMSPSRYRDPYLNPWVAMASLVLAAKAIGGAGLLSRAGFMCKELTNPIGKSTMGIFVSNPLIIHLIRAIVPFHPDGVTGRFFLTLFIAIVATLSGWFLTSALKRVKCGFLVGG